MGEISQQIFKCHCGAETVYGEGPGSLNTMTTRPRIRCSNPDHPGLHLHLYSHNVFCTWKDWRENDPGTQLADSMVAKGEWPIRELCHSPKIPTP